MKRAHCLASRVLRLAFKAGPRHAAAGFDAMKLLRSGESVHLGVKRCGCMRGPWGRGEPKAQSTEAAHTRRARVPAVVVARARVRTLA